LSSQKSSTEIVFLMLGKYIECMTNKLSDQEVVLLQVQNFELHNQQPKVVLTLTKYENQETWKVNSTCSLKCRGGSSIERWQYFVFSLSLSLSRVT